MNFFLTLLEKILVNILIGVLLIFLSFSYFTGKFPPRKEDIAKAFFITKELFLSSPQSRQGLQDQQNSNPNLEQVVEIQRLALKRSEAVLQLTKIMEKLPKTPGSEKVADKLQKASDQLNQVDETMNELSLALQSLADKKNSEPPKQ